VHQFVTFMVRARVLKRDPFKMMTLQLERLQLNINIATYFRHIKLMKEESE